MSAPSHSARAGLSPQGGPIFHVRCEDLFKIYKLAEIEVVALRGLDLRVRQGELMAIVGASGSGKSTLLNILAGLDVPSAGRATVAGRDLVTMTESDLVTYRRREVGFVWQQTSRNLVPYLTARQNVEVPLALAGLHRSEARQRATDLLELVGLGHRVQNRPMQLSGGEQQRVSIAVALANQPPLLLADEPTGNLDPKTAEEVFNVMLGLARGAGLAALVATHNPELAARMDRTVRLENGVLV